MAWFLDPVALRRVRESLHLSQREASKRTGLSLWTIQRHESERLAPATLQEESIERYADAFRSQQQAFMYWSAQPRERTSRPSACQSGVTTASGSYEIMDAAMHRRCSTAYALYADRRYAVTGRVDHYASVPEWVARALDAQPGEAARFQLRHQVADEPSVSVTVFTRAGEHTRRLMDQAEKKQSALVIAALVPKSRSEPSQGFPVFAKRATHRPFAFVVEELVTANACA